MATKNYMINDKWLDLDKQNIVELQSVDGVLDSMKVNGSEIETPSGKIMITENGTDIDVAQYALADVNVEGGGGSSDFSTATMTVNGNFTQSDLFIAPVIEKDPNNEDIAFPQIQSGNSTYTVILYKGRSVLMFMGSQSRTITVSGNIETASTGVYIITGDCTITIS